MTGWAPAVQCRPSGEVAAWRDGLMQAWMFGVHAWWSVSRDEPELRRRGRASLADLERLDVLDVVLQLPIGQIVVQSKLSTRQRDTLSNLDPAVVEQHREGFVRHARPCLNIERVVVPARTFRTGLGAATLFANYCVPSIMLPSTVRVSDLELAEASFYGVGVMRAIRGGSVELLEPEPFEELPHTPASWAFNEVLARKLSSIG
jgi:hypothetical protein